VAILVSIGRFHHFHLARQLEKRGLLEAIYTGYPRFKLQDESGIPPGKIHTFPWLHTPFMARGRFGLDRWEWLNREWAWYAQETLDRYVASRAIQDPAQSCCRLSELRRWWSTTRTPAAAAAPLAARHISLRDCHATASSWGWRGRGGSSIRVNQGCFCRRCTPRLGMQGSSCRSGIGIQASRILPA